MIWEANKTKIKWPARDWWQKFFFGQLAGSALAFNLKLPLHGKFQWFKVHDSNA